MAERPERAEPPSPHAPARGRDLRASQSAPAPVAVAAAARVETAGMDVAATTEHPSPAAASGASARGRTARPAAGPDRASVLLFSVAAFLVVLALLAWQLRATPAKT